MVVLEGASSRLCPPGAKCFAAKSSYVAASTSTSLCLDRGRRNSPCCFLNGTGKLEFGSNFRYSFRTSSCKASSVRLKVQCRAKGFGEKSPNAGRKEPSNGASSSGNGSPEVMPLKPKVDRVGGEEVAAKGAWEGLNWKDFATPAASPVLDMSEPKVRRVNRIH